MNIYFRNARTAKPNTYGAYNVLILISVAVIICANIVAVSLQNKFALGIDFSSGKIYTLSATTEKVLENMREDISIYPIYSSGGQDKTIAEILKKYAAASPFIHIKEFSGNSSAILEAFGEAYDLKESGIILASQDHTVFTFISEGDLYAVDQNMNLLGITAESKITSAIDSIVKGAFSKIRLLTGHGETGTARVSGFLEALKLKNYMVDSYNISESAETLNAKTDILAVVSPRTDLLESEYNALIDFFNAGGRAIMLMDNSFFNEDLGQMQIYMNDLPFFNALISRFDLRLNNDLVISKDPAHMNLRSTSISMMANIHSITQHLTEANLPIVMSEASSIEFTDKTDATIFALLSTNSKSYAKQLTNGMNNLTQSPVDKTGSFTVGAISELQNSKLILFSTSSCIGNDAFAIPGNQELMESSIDYLNPMGRTIHISTKPFGIQNLPNFDTLSRLLLFLFSAILLPATVLVFGIKRCIKYKK